MYSDFKMNQKIMKQSAWWKFNFEVGSRLKIEKNFIVFRVKSSVIDCWKFRNPFQPKFLWESMLHWKEGCGKQCYGKSVFQYMYIAFVYFAARWLFYWDKSRFSDHFGTFHACLPLLWHFLKMFGWFWSGTSLLFAVNSAVISSVFKKRSRNWWQKCEILSNVGQLWILKR